MREMNGTTPPVLFRKDVEALIAQGRKLFILDDLVIKADAWIPYHPGGDKSIFHIVGRDTTDKVTALHLIEAKQRMSRYRIGTIQGRWENFVPPIQGGTFRLQSDSGRDAYRHAHTASSPASSRRSSVPDSDNSDGVSSIHSEEPYHRQCFLFILFIISLDLETYPPLDHATPDAVVAAYRRLDDRLRAQGLYDCSFRAAVCMGAFWNQMSFAAHDAGHISITHRFHMDSVLGIFIAGFMGGLSLGW
ncbi:Delta 8-(E)-sphingolipid desaturase [Colletotrichum siamense]|nr:Delta 8-(E)-sphingolipid desaturase [Colletotrichum siamense]